MLRFGSSRVSRHRARSWSPGALGPKSPYTGDAGAAPVGPQEKHHRSGGILIEDGDKVTLAMPRERAAWLVDDIALLLRLVDRYVERLAVAGLLDAGDQASRDRVAALADELRSKLADPKPRA